nr:hypothetical protein [Tanacetum cinerariifolium]
MQTSSLRSYPSSTDAIYATTIPISTSSSPQPPLPSLPHHPQPPDSTPPPSSDPTITTIKTPLSPYLHPATVK